MPGHQIRGLGRRRKTAKSRTARSLPKEQAAVRQRIRFQQNHLSLLLRLQDTVAHPGNRDHQPRNQLQAAPRLKHVLINCRIVHRTVYQVVRMSPFQDTSLLSASDKGVVRNEGSPAKVEIPATVGKTENLEMQGTPRIIATQGQRNQSAQGAAEIVQTGDQSKVKPRATVPICHHARPNLSGSAIDRTVNHGATDRMTGSRMRLLPIPILRKKQPNLQ